MTDSAEVVGLTFDVELSATDADHQAVYGDFTFSLHAAEHDVDVVFGSPGQAYRGSLASAAGKLELANGVRIRDHGSPDYSDSAHNGLFLEALSLCVKHEEGEPATFEGAGTLRVVANGDDYINEWETAVDVHGVLDETPPAWARAEPFDPLNHPMLAVSEPIEVGASAKVVLENEDDLELVPVTQALTVVGFDTARVLPLGFHGEVTSKARDFANNLLKDAGFALETLADPGLQAQDGFESELHATYTASERASFSPQKPVLVGGDQALSGARSLLVDAGSVVVFRLKRPSASAKHVRLALKPLVDVADFEQSIIVRAGAVGESNVVSAEIPVELLEPGLGAAGAGGAAGQGGAGCDSCEGVATNVDLVVEGTSDEILVSIDTPGIELSASSIARALVDELRVE